MSNIEWTERTWNPLAGCTRVSEGCDNCYAASMAIRLGAMAEADIAAGRTPGKKAKYIGIARRNERGVAAFNGKINLDESALVEPSLRRAPTTYFVNSMSDLFHKDVPDEFIRKVFKVMCIQAHHTFQVLTKRPERMADWVMAHMCHVPDHIWLGTSTENQATYNERIPHLAGIEATTFLSMEPLLGPVILDEYYPVSWVIVGGESGPRARPMHPDWARSIRAQCQAAGVPFFFKQWGGRNKKASGRLLDGREWSEMP